MAWITGKRGAYRVMWREGGRGSALKASRTYESRLDAEEKQREVEAEAAERKRMTGAATPSEPIESLLKRWGASRLAEGRARPAWIAEATAYVRTVCTEMEWTRVGQVTAEGIDRWRAKRPGGKGTDKPLQALKGFIRWCHDVLRLRVDPFAMRVRARARKPKPQAPLLTEEQVAAILRRALEAGGRHAATLVEHLVLYGCRPVDVCKLEVRDWRDGVITYRDTKNKADVSHACHEAHGAKLSALCLEEQDPAAPAAEPKPRPPSAPLFLDPWGRPWALNKHGKAVSLSSWYRTNVGVPLLRREEDGKQVGCLAPSQLGIYVLKDYAMTRMANASGGDRKAVVAISGHKTLAVVDRYLATNAAAQRRLIDAVPAPAVS